MALGAYKLCEYLQKLKVIPAKGAVPVLLAVVSIISFQNIRFYMIEYREKMYFQDAGGEFAMEAGFLANKTGDDFHIYVLGAPRLFSDFPTISFIAPQNPHSDLRADGIESLKTMPRQKAIFIATPENKSLLDEVSRIYPGGKDGLIYRIPQPQELLMAYYIVS